MGRYEKEGKYEVFLGGSCNPTTWRQDVAIPLLKSRGVTFYNPQVSNWRPELIEIEHHAKESAAVLFFVIDNQTRNTATSVEVAYYAGLRRNIILVIQPYQSSGCKIGGEPVADDELADLIATQQVMKSLIERQGMPVFHSIPDALNCTAKVLRDNISIQELGIKEIVPPVKMGHIQLGDKLIKLREAFDALDTSGTGQITLRDVCIAFRVLTNKSLSDADLRNVVSGQAGDLEREAKENVSFEDLRVNFDQFCAVVAEFKSSQEKWSTLPLRASGIPASRRSNCSRDVYLGGSGVNTTWREDVAIPILKKNGLTYFNPVNNHWVRRLALQAANAMDNSHILLFVVTDTARSLPEMSMASHYIGLGWNVVLCVQLFTEDSTVCGSKLSKDALKDYNRGRMYLRDLAARESVPVFDTVAAAVECVVSKCTTCY